ncbi:HAD family phosphatase [Chelatococcus sp. SYSU_G07232]|uniref:HAD family phosphatase n=1 Tax=Chelatococcus albus TaxID=3047466 RepID=A0ABT7AE38_9HYPH|nr:HAD family phosphatase [Chelatococcus sp. SYSU_G07232]MDJ1157653.1 HAD family phosphatase [Chelatococcus sp. SYSU_G07232]
MHAPAPSPARIVVFDIGNVLIEWDPRHLYRKIFGGDEGKVEAFLGTVCTPAWNLEQDRGRRWADAVAELSAAFPQWRAEIAAYDERWHEMVPGAIQGTVAILDRLRSAGVPTYAITNFSDEKFVEARLRFPFLEGFEGIVVSAEVGLLKPDLAIYSLFLDRYGLAAGDCIFVDDSPRNVAAARAVGMHAHHFTTPDAFAAELRAHGFPV